MTTNLIPAPDARPTIAPDAAATSLQDQFRAEVLDAHLLLQHATATGRTAPDSIITDVTVARMLLASQAAADPDIWNKVARAHRQLAETMAPVTAATLRATSDEFGMPGRWPLRGRISAAKRWNRSLWIYALAFASAILLTENYNSVLATFFARDENTADTVLWRYILDNILQTLIPFAYGGLGAATYLLRSAHVHVHARTFDPNFIPEYYSRLLLGIVAGGTIQLLIDRVSDGGEVIHLSAAALAFIAGYNADLVFKVIERISDALLPKVGVESVRRAPPMSMAGMTLPALIKQLDEAKTPEAKQAIQSLIAKVRERV